MSKIKLTLIKSLSGRLKSHQACAKGLGLRKIHKSVEVVDTPENRGMIKAISIIIKLENPVKYKVLNFSNPNLNVVFFFKTKPREDKNF